MNNPTATDFPARLAKLEHENRVYRRILGTVLIGGFAVTLAGADPLDGVKKVVEAERFVVRDTKGKERIRIGTEEDGDMASILLLDAQGKDVVKISVNHATKSSAFALMTPNESSSLVLYMKDDGSAFLAFQKAEKVRMSLGMKGGDAGPAIHILDKEGLSEFQAPAP